MSVWKRLRTYCFKVKIAVALLLILILRGEAGIDSGRRILYSFFFQHCSLFTVICTPLPSVSFSTPLPLPSIPYSHRSPISSLVLLFSFYPPSSDQLPFHASDQPTLIDSLSSSFPKLSFTRTSPFFVDLLSSPSPVVSPGCLTNRDSLLLCVGMLVLRTS